jgi:hypothetical protein
MIEITVNSNNRPSSQRAIAFAEQLMASKREMIEESRNNVNTPEFQEMLSKLKEINAIKRRRKPL